MIIHNMEKWEFIDGWEDSYKISNLGRVLSIRTGLILKPNARRRGYLYVTFFRNNKGKHYRVHRLVAETFIRKSLVGEQVNHKDFNVQNNAVDNLEWCTPAENKQHQIVNKIIPCKKRILLNKYQRARIKLIRDIDKKITLVKIGSMFGVDDDRIRTVLAK